MSLSLTWLVLTKPRKKFPSWWSSSRTPSDSRNLVDVFRAAFFLKDLQDAARRCSPAPSLARRTCRSSQFPVQTS